MLHNRIRHLQGVGSLEYARYRAAFDGKTPKQLRDGTYIEIIQSGEAIRNGETIEELISFSISRENVEALDSLNVYLLDAGDDAMLLRCLTLEILDVEDRKEAARKLSKLRQLHFQYLDLAGQWQNCYGERDVGFSNLKPAPESAYSESETSGFTSEPIDSEECILDITNDTEIVLKITLLGGGNSHVKELSPGGMTQIKMDPGRYHYSASGKGVITDRGIEKLDAGLRYGWKFFVKKQ